MKTTIKFLAVAAFLVISIASCETKKNENADTNGNDTISTDTTSIQVAPDTVKSDTATQTPAQ